MLSGSLYDALRLFPADSFKTAGEVGADPAAAEYLYRNGFLDCRYGGIDPIIARGLIARPEPSYRLNFLGSNALKEFEQERIKCAEHEAEKNADKAQAVKDKRQDRKHDYLVALFGAIVGSLFTLLFEHIGEVVAFIKDFLH